MQVPLTQTDIYICKLKIIGSSLPQTTTKQTAVNIHAETLKKNSTNCVVAVASAGLGLRL